MTTIPSVTMERAAHLARDGKPWRVLLHTRPGVVTARGALRSAFWQATGNGHKIDRMVEIRWGRQGSSGQVLRTTLAMAMRKIAKALAGDYEYAGIPATVGSAPALLAQHKAKPQRVVTMRERLAGCTMRPTTMAEVWQRVADEGLVRMTLDVDYTDIHRGCDGLVMYQATKAGRQGALYVVVRYPNGEMVWGSPRVD